MKKGLVHLLLLSAGLCYTAHSQTNAIRIKAQLDTDSHTLDIQQQIVFHNKASVSLTALYLHNWPNAFKDSHTPLAKRFVEDHKKSFQFSKEKHRGHTKIMYLSAAGQPAAWEVPRASPDLLKVLLNKPLEPSDSVVLSAQYTVKIPRDRFTHYGVANNQYQLRYWYLIPAVHQGQWKPYSHLNMDDLYADLCDYDLTIDLPSGYQISSDLTSSHRQHGNKTQYKMTGNKRPEIQLNITQNSSYQTYRLHTEILTDIQANNLDSYQRTLLLNRSLGFIEKYLGSFPRERLLLSAVEYEKNPVYGLGQLPPFLKLYDPDFEWDVKMLKILSKKYLENLFLFHPREDRWLMDGIQTYLMIKYVEKYYPDVKLIGAPSQYWGIRAYHAASLPFNARYQYLYRFAARKNLDQALTTRSDSLSNFNRKIISKYKAGLGIKYLEAYLGEEVLRKGLVNFSNKYRQQFVHSSRFVEMLETSKDLDWFKEDFLQSDRHIDYTIQDVSKQGDSLDVRILNKHQNPAPIALYGIQNHQVKFKKWLAPFDSLASFKIPSKGIDRLSLNYESEVPEVNTKNNWYNTTGKLGHRPLQIRPIKDLENPHKNQLFFKPFLVYNYYDGAALGVQLMNNTILHKDFTYQLSPSYSTKSKTFSGAYALLYQHYPEQAGIHALDIGLIGSNYQYAKNLQYNTFTPFAMVEFKRKNLRHTAWNILLGSYTHVNREIGALQAHPETNKYGVLNLTYSYGKTDVLREFYGTTNLQYSRTFSKISFTSKFRKVGYRNKSLECRLFTGLFLSNQTETDFFSFALDRPSDYLFQYSYLGRSETSGFFSQQIIINEGGFKSKLPVAYANQWLSTLNTSIGLQRWLEIYNDIGWVKNKGQKAYFAHENGLRLNLIKDIAEIYFPIHSNNGWELSQKDYHSKIRFLLVSKPEKIYHFIKRGFY